MQISKDQIKSILSLEDDYTSKDIGIALRNIEIVLDGVAANLEDDFESAALGDASNLIQMLRAKL